MVNFLILGPYSAATALGHCRAGKISQPHTQVELFPLIMILDMNFICMIVGILPFLSKDSCRRIG